MVGRYGIQGYSAETASSDGANKMVDFPARLDAQPYAQKLYLLVDIVGERERPNLGFARDVRDA